MNIYLGADHAGFEMKEEIKKMLVAAGHKAVDKGAHALDLGDDYPQYMRAVAEDVMWYKGSFGILFGGSGQGEAIVTNRIPGIRTAVYYGGQKEIITLSREHGDANILSLGARFLTIDEAKEAVTLWLNTKFSGDERHIRRLAQIDKFYNHGGGCSCH